MTNPDLSRNRFDVYASVTDIIIKAIEAGPGEFLMPWHRSGNVIGRPRNAATDAGYRGVNVIALWAAALLGGFSSGVWATYRQWRALGAQVRRNEKGSVILFYRPLTPKTPEEEEPNLRFVARASWVFNSDQVSGWDPPLPTTVGEAERIAEAEQLIARTGAEVRHGGEEAYYSPRYDRIHIPDLARFIGSPTRTATEAYYATVLHELVHWTGAPHRLNRSFGQRFGDHAYAFEELVAELGAAFLCADLGLANEPRPDHAAYLAEWLEVLSRDKRAIVTASHLAADAARVVRPDS